MPSSVAHDLERALQLKEEAASVAAAPAPDAVETAVETASMQGGQSTTNVTDAAFQQEILPELETDAVEGQETKIAVLQEVHRLLNEHGSAGRLLRNRHGNARASESFAEELHSMHVHAQGWLNLELSLPFSTSGDDVTQGGQVRLSLASFNFQPESTLQAEPDNAKVMELCEHILTDGFLSSEEPLLCTQPAELLSWSTTAGVKCPWMQISSLMNAQCIGYMKGCSRMYSLLSVLSVCFERRINIHKDLVVPRVRSCL